MKIWERVVKPTCEQHYGFMTRKSLTETVLTLGADGVVQGRTEGFLVCIYIFRECMICRKLTNKRDLRNSIRKHGVTNV